MTTYHRRLSRAAAPPPRLPQHYTVTRKLGFAPVMACWCGAEIPLPKATTSHPSSAYRAWRAVHDECDAPPRRQEAS